MRVDIAYAGVSDKVWLQVEVPDGCTVAEGIAASGILERCPEIDLDTQKIGVFGKAVKKDAPLRPGDRVEIYRPIICDPAKVPRKNGADDDDDDD
ncbi:RnfH family protein [Methyloversatilis thermotolerans]|uniref:RnfH family protein n=1 Tax=Methyloversatilis thermotolerans TaxID=1346290 RepID=UPI000382680A|nr:RnfH family protein [Methyloversatilis thermotolerans]